eukprot:TRINITY_DN1347_c0_g1_i1.p1 TRINITY_DN1347_c0_g1~~TRINITY_DN1347_c0_g1_i1.p1  ORF type:complete len:626 (+),score=116.52 TRINITY_DN1347_c0_g1_i1:35-1879(+)
MYEPVSNDNSGSNKKRRLIISLLLILVILIIIIIIVAVTASGGSSNYEDIFLSVPSPENARETSKHLSSAPHIAGSYEDYDTAVWVRDQFLEYGIPDAQIQTYEVMLSYPVQRRVALVYPSSYECVLKEEAIPEDETSGDPRAIDTFNGYSDSGDVEGELVYANYGRIEDFEELDNMGLNLTGKIVIVRYGKIFRGNKVQLAAQRGAIGVLIYSDPADDGFARGPVYPEGPYRTNTSVQRGSVSYALGGDPITPGYPSTPNAPRYTFQQARNEMYQLPNIPVQPISYGDAAPLLSSIELNPAPAAWRGALPLNYNIGPGPARVQMNITVNDTRTTIWNVIARIKGSVEPDRLVLIGSHRDAWTFGNVDPISGQTTMLEAARGIGQIYKKGWRPRRSIMFCSWDAEEYNLIGSVEFVEQYEKLLIEQGVIYINLDTAVFGTESFSASGVPSIGEILRSSSKRINIPTPKDTPAKTIYNLWSQSQGNINQTKLDLLGSGSDFLGFISHIGIPSADLSFESDDYAVYHSNYDSYYWTSHFGDPTFEYHTSLAKLTGLLALQFIDSKVLPFDLTEYASYLYDWIKEVENYAKATLPADTFNFSPLYESVSRPQPRRFR